MSKLKIVKEKVDDILLASTAHGVPNIIKSEKASIKIMWFICLTLSTGCCGFFITRSILDYLNFDAVTQYDIKYETTSEFPVITFCSEPSFDIHFKLNESLVHCYINMDTECRKKPMDYFQKFFDSKYGMCFRLNGDSNHVITSTQSGYEFGLRVSLKLENPIGNKYRQLIIGIHNKSNIPINLYNKGYEISPGSRFLFTIERTFIELLGPPYSSCINDINSFDKNKTLINFIQNLTSYNQKLCYELCFELRFIENKTCNCTKSLGHVIKECSSKNCFFEFREHFYKSNVEEYCSNYCPLECNLSDYSITQTHFEYPSSNGTIHNTNEKLKNFTTYQEVKLNYFEFYVYYSDLKYVLITETPKLQITDLVSNIGGTFGLFIGISFLSVIEIFEIIFETCFTLCSKKIQQKD